MIRMKRGIIVSAGLIAFALAALLPPAMATDIPIITKEELQSRMEQGEIVVIDVRKGRDWDSSEFKIKGAQRPAGKDVAAWAGSFNKDKPTVLYCA